jgi:hypothetical protein
LHISIAITARNPVIDTEIPAGTDKEQGQQHDEVGRGKLDTVVEDDEFTRAGQPFEVAVLL